EVIAGPAPGVGLPGRPGRLSESVTRQLSPLPPATEPPRGSGFDVTPAPMDRRRSSSPPAPAAPHPPSVAWPGQHERRPPLGRQVRLPLDGSPSERGFPLSSRSLSAAPPGAPSRPRPWGRRNQLTPNGGSGLTSSVKRNRGALRVSP